MSKSGLKRAYTVVLADKSAPPAQHDANDVNVHDGALMLLNGDGPIAIYAAGEWAKAELVERERKPK